MNPLKGPALQFNLIDLKILLEQNQIQNVDHIFNDNLSGAKFSIRRCKPRMTKEPSA